MGRDGKVDVDEGKTGPAKVSKCFSRYQIKKHFTRFTTRPADHNGEASTPLHSPLVEFGRNSTQRTLPWLHFCKTITSYRFDPHGWSTRKVLIRALKVANQCSRLAPRRRSQQRGIDTIVTIHPRIETLSHVKLGLSMLPDYKIILD